MTRLLLALLALFAGLATQVAPAQARMVSNDVSEVGSVADTREARPSPSPSTEVDSPVLRQARRDRTSNRARPARSRVFIPSVLFGPDRAFE